MSELADCPAVSTHVVSMLQDRLGVTRGIGEAGFLRLKDCLK